MTPEALENRLLSSLRLHTDITTLQGIGISADSFLTTEPVDHGAVWDYYVEHFKNHGQPPTTEDLAFLYGFEPTNPGDLQTYATLVRNEELGRRARSVLMQEVEHLEGNEVPATIRAITQRLSELKTEGAKRAVSLDGDASERLKVYEDMAEQLRNGEIVGISTGLQTFDRQHLGYVPGELVIVMGGTGVGKSWLLMHMGIAAYEAGKKVLMISPELTAHEQGLRFDVILASHRRVKLSNYELSTGQADHAVYSDWLATLADRRDFNVIDSSDTGQPISFDDIWRYCIEYQPDELLIDGLHLIAPLSSKSEKQGWEVLKQGAAYLKSLAQQERVVVLAAHQPDRTASKKGARVPPGVSQIAYGFAVVESANRVISLARRDNEHERVYIVPKMRGAAEIVEGRVLHWDVDAGEIWEKAMVDLDEF